MVWKWPTQTQKHLKYNHWHLQKSQDRSGSTTHYFTSSDPHHGISGHILSHIFWPILSHIFWHSICHSFWHLFGILFGILSGIYSDILTGILSDILLWHSLCSAGPLGSGACGRGPAGNTLILSLQLRSGGGGGGGAGRGGGGGPADIKSRNPHLTGGGKKMSDQKHPKTSNKLPKDNALRPWTPSSTPPPARLPCWARCGDSVPSRSLGKQNPSEFPSKNGPTWENHPDFTPKCWGNH